MEHVVPCLGSASKHLAVRCRPPGQGRTRSRTEAAQRSRDGQRFEHLGEIRGGAQTVATVLARGVLLLPDMKPEKPTQRDANQGEGDRISAHHYNERVREFVADGRVEPTARDAEIYVTRDPEDAARAERKAKRGPRSTRVTIDELVAMGRTVVDRARPYVDRAVAQIRNRLGRK
jgi:hypothetical protein